MTAKMFLFLMATVEVLVFVALIVGSGCTSLY